MQLHALVEYETVEAAEKAVSKILVLICTLHIKQNLLKSVFGALVS